MTITDNWLPMNDEGDEFATINGKRCEITYNVCSGVCHGTILDKNGFTESSMTMTTPNGSNEDFELMRRIISEIANRAEESK
jgi:hypothetical protein